MRLTRDQILAFRRRTGGLDSRVPLTAESLRRAGWAGLQDSMPRAALLSLHARIEGVTHDVLDHKSLAQLWGPRYSTYVVPKRDFALFSLGRLPDDEKGRARAERTAELLHAFLDGRRMPDREAHAALRVGNSIKYATTTGTIAIRWEGARAPQVWTVPAPKITPANACRELAKRYLHVFGPTTAKSFARWAGISQRAATTAFASIELIQAGDAFLLAEDETLMLANAQEPAPARLLPSGDAYWLLDGAERAVLVPDAKQQAKLWTPRVWPGALLVDGEIRGTWRRAQHKLDIEAWGRLSRAQRDAVEAEAASLPLPALDRDIVVAWS
ncbi:MAG TPA: crosslink repair DNA glycosylase YcaQ family protein [Gaiellaceae bacterium]|nr:crosslink repair DNA glycosylase YcaQ family protein [Gaiellaceae bacterium]